jgi:hypothetical protein
MFAFWAKFVMNQTLLISSTGMKQGCPYGLETQLKEKQ